MRLEPEQPEDDDADAVEIGAAPTVGLWGPHYGALWATGLALAAMISVPRSSGVVLALVLAGWALGLGVMAVLSCNQRLALQDLLAGLLPRERLLLAVLLVGVMLGPSLTEDCHVLIDGWLWVAPLLLLLAVTPVMARIYLGVTLLGAWMTAGGGGREPCELALLLVFGVCWLAAIGAVHFAHTGDPHGLAGWWPLWRLLVSVLQAALPAVVAAAAIWWIWPATGLHRAYVGIRLVDVVAPGPARAGRVPDFEIVTLIWQLFLACLMIFWMVWVMLYLRRLFAKRSGAAPGLDLMPEQSARMEYRAAPPSRPRPTLGGARGQIVALWRRWSEAMGREAAVRRDGETARDFTRRLGSELPAAEPGPEMTRLLERAHYSPDGPDSDDVERMRRIVETELSRQSLRRQVPPEPLD